MSSDYDAVWDGRRLAAVIDVVLDIIYKRHYKENFKLVVPTALIGLLNSLKSMDLFLDSKFPCKELDRTPLWESMNAGLYHWFPIGSHPDSQLIADIVNNTKDFVPYLPSIISKQALKLGRGKRYCDESNKHKHRRTAFDDLLDKERSKERRGKWSLVCLKLGSRLHKRRRPKSSKHLRGSK